MPIIMWRKTFFWCESFHPLSVNGDNLYFLMSMWMPYNVFLMKAEIADMGNF